MTAFNSQSVKFPKKGEGLFFRISNITWEGMMPKFQTSKLAVADMKSEAANNHLINITNEEKQTSNKVNSEAKSTTTATAN